MSPEQYKKIKSILMEAIELDNQELKSFLDIKCGSDEGLRNEIESLIKLDIGDTFLAHSPVQIESPDELSGKIGRIKIDHLIARGGMGDVYAGTDELLGRPVAIKILTSGLRLSAVRRTGFLNEAKLLSSLQHPNICQLYDFFEDQERDVIALELIDGNTLRKLLNSGSLPNPNLAALQLAKALTAAHEMGISHHDLKPENLMLDRDGTLKVLDFGLAKTDETYASGKTGEVSGTPAYMSPEQAQGKPVGTASDIYSMGLILIELWTGTAPRTLHSLQSDSELLSISVKDLPHAERQLLTQMLDIKATNRPSARQVLGEIKNIIQRPKRRWKWAGIATLLTLMVFSVWKYTHDLQLERNLAIEAKDEAIQARNDAEGLIAFMMDDLQSGLRSIGKLNLLESVANQVMTYYGELDPDLMLATRGKPAVALAQVGEVLDYKGDKAKAIKVLKQAIEALQSLHHKNPVDALVRYHLANTQTLLGQNYKLNGDFEQAHQVLSSAIEHGKQLTAGLTPGQGPTEEPNATERWSILLNAYYIFGDVYMRKGQGHKAVASLEEIIDDARLSVQNNPDLTRFLADIEFKLCDTYYDIPMIDKVIQPCLATLAMDKALHQQEPENYRLHANFGISLSTLARAYALIGDGNQASKYINQAIAEFRQLHEWEPDDAARKNDLVITLLAKGKMLMEFGQTATATPILEEAESIVMTLYHDKKEITVLNNSFAIKLLLGKTEEARPIGAELHKMGFRRREFAELCEQFDIQECLD